VAPLPGREEVERKLQELIDGTVAREEASEWARPFIVEEAGPPRVADEAAWTAIGAIGMADAPTTDRRYLYDVEDFEAWLQELRDAPPASTVPRSEHDL